MKYSWVVPFLLASCAPARAEENFDHGEEAAWAQAAQMRQNYDNQWQQEQAQHQIEVQQQQLRAQQQEIQRYDNASPIERMTGRY